MAILPGEANSEYVAFGFMTVKMAVTPEMRIIYAMVSRLEPKSTVKVSPLAKLMLEP